MAGSLLSHGTCQFGGRRAKTCASNDRENARRRVDYFKRKYKLLTLVPVRRQRSGKQGDADARGHVSLPDISLTSFKIVRYSILFN